VREPIKFLRQREIVHYQRFAECLGIVQDTFEDKKNYYLYNPAFDCGCNGKK
jgi:spore coat protein JC